MNWYKTSGKENISGLKSLTERDRLFETGMPVELDYIRNTQPASDMGSRFGQDIEPAGRYMSHASPSAQPRDGLEIGKTKFSNPLVIALTEDDESIWGEIYGDKGWKRRLSNAYNGLTGLELSKAILADGYDGIVTIDTLNGSPRSVAEIVDLKGL